jgi:hypothetical protein
MFAFMRHKLLTLLLVPVLLSTNAPLVFSQQTNNWSTVQALKTNEKLVVKQKDGREFKGEMIEASDTTLTIDRDGKPFSIARADVRNVHVIAGKAKKGKWALIGAGIGAGTGTAIGAAKYSPESDDSEIYAVIGLLIGAGTGAVGGLIFGQTRRNRTLVYATN